MKFYLGGPINGCTDEEASGWREAVKELLTAEGQTWLDPMDRDYRGREMDPGIAEEIVKGDKVDINMSDVLLMNAPKPSYGTAMEIFYGSELGKWVVVVLPDDGKDPSPWVKHHADYIHRGTVLGAVTCIVTGVYPIHLEEPASYGVDEGGTFGPQYFAELDRKVAP